MAVVLANYEVKSFKKIGKEDAFRIALCESFQTFMSQFTLVHSIFSKPEISPTLRHKVSIILQEFIFFKKNEILDLVKNEEILEKVQVVMKEAAQNIISLIRQSDRHDEQSLPPPPRQVDNLYMKFRKMLNNICTNYQNSGSLYQHAYFFKSEDEWILLTHMLDAAEMNQDRINFSIMTESKFEEEIKSCMRLESNGHQFPQDKELREETIKFFRRFVYVRGFLISSSSLQIPGGTCISLCGVIYHVSIENQAIQNEWEKIFSLFPDFDPTSGYEALTFHHLGTLLDAAGAFIRDVYIISLNRKGSIQFLPDKAYKNRDVVSVKWASPGSLKAVQTISGEINISSYSRKPGEVIWPCNLSSSFLATPIMQRHINKVLVHYVEQSYIDINKDGTMISVAEIAKVLSLEVYRNKCEQTLSENKVLTFYTDISWIRKRKMVFNLPTGISKTMKTATEGTGMLPRIILIISCYYLTLYYQQLSSREDSSRCNPDFNIGQRCPITRC
jgi:hypothetical protein